MERKKRNFLQKLYSREVHGTFFRGRPVVHNRAIKLFGGVIPNRLVFILRDIFDRRTEHILLGTSRCGQFLITYSYTSEMPHPVGLQVHYKYRLHWWAFRVMAPAYKVAEVQLFDSQDAPPHSLNIGIAQWPNVNDRLIVYGYSNEGDHVVDINTLSDPADMPTRKYYITVTTLPSLHNCRDCKAVAESFDEEDMAVGWDRAISFSCLKHGLTIHTTLDVAPPYPAFDPHTSLKIDNKIIVNTGNFLHVLSFAMDKEEKTSTERDTIAPDDISHRVGEMLSCRFKDYICPWKMPGNTSSLTLPYRKTLSRSINKAWLNTIMDRANKVYAFEETEDGCEPRFKWFKKRRLADKMYEFCSDDEDMENKCPPVKIPRLAEPNSSDGPKTSELTKAAKLKIERQLIVSDSPMDPFKKRDENEVDKDVWFNRPLIHGDPGVPLVRPERPIFFKSLLPNFWKEKSEHCDLNSKVSVPNSSICDSDVNSSQNDLYSPYSPSTDKPTVSTVSEIRQNLVDTNCRSTQSCLNNSSKPSNTSATLVSDNSPVSSTSEIKSVPSRSDHSIPPLDISVINPDLSALLAEWEADSVSSLSPRSDSLSKNDVIQSFLELIPGMTISPRSSGSSSTPGTGENLSSKVNDGTHSASKMSSPNSSVNKYSPLLVVLRTRNCNQDKEPQKTKEQEDRLKTFPKEEVVSKAKSTKESDVSLRQRMISGCSVRFDRIYIELDDEIISTISTDFEDDDQGTGFHCALPLSVHGSAYAQLQMVSSHKAEKLSMECERVFQTSLDIEQFCFKAAEIICECEGFKFWFCSDYDVELIDVCAFNGDILGVVCLRVNAEKKPPKNENYSQVNQRYFYGMKCVFVWNPVRDRCWLEAYSPLVETQQVSRAWEAPARREAERLRHHLYNTTLFTLPPHPPIRTFEHRMWTNEVLRPTVEEFRDYHNLVAFRLRARSSGRRRARASDLRRRFFNPVTEFWG